MINWLKKVFRFMACGSVALIIAACYGMPAGYDYFYKSYKTKDSNNNPIPGLKLSLIQTSIYSDESGTHQSVTTNNSVSTTDEQGYAYVSGYLWGDDQYKVLIEDVDGSTNGSWKSTNFIIVPYNNYETNEVIMKDDQ